MRLARLATTATAALLVLTGCTGSADDDPGAEPATTVAPAPDAEAAAEAEAAEVIAEAVGGDREGRAFDSTDDAVITAITAATGAVSAEWDGATLRATFEDGSADNMLDGMPCSAIDAVIAADESAVLVFPDGELDCSTWRK